MEFNAARRGPVGNSTWRQQQMQAIIAVRPSVVQKRQPIHHARRKGAGAGANNAGAGAAKDRNARPEQRRTSLATGGLTPDSVPRSMVVTRKDSLACGGLTPQTNGQRGGMAIYTESDLARSVEDLTAVRVDTSGRRANPFPPPPSNGNLASGQGQLPVSVTLPTLPRAGTGISVSTFGSEPAVPVRRRGRRQQPDHTREHMGNGNVLVPTQRYADKELRTDHYGHGHEDKDTVDHFGVGFNMSDLLMGTTDTYDVALGYHYGHGHEDKDTADHFTGGTSCMLAPSDEPDAGVPSANVHAPEGSMNSSCLGSNLVPAAALRKPKPPKAKRGVPQKNRKRGLTPALPGMVPMPHYSTVRQRKLLAKQRTLQTKDYVSKFSRRSQKTAM